MYLVLYCHNIGMTDFSFFETGDFDKEDGYIVRGKWPNEQAFRRYLTTELGDLANFHVIDLIAEGPRADSYSQADLTALAATSA
ncbi:hypothetical protein [Vibrio genomosp. F10]|uniref:Uncharacterized protein n=2 Tax=Vibrio genomosp. F10 TaxID=723171 RepID=A0A1B9R1Y6_9VIBR|nr:hypothetical protein [Vibrio genomosp. F10]OCH78054.1 hypothetical protein A6E14_06380 [Vibrio genomosp. F10]OEE37511.1 hypothetical protein A1QO_17385 [Vibrio genomosp. F10 str. ZF-129]OEE94505.1 hypothetical protein A1QM_18575 [Vibrio genomosp. F10 str. 9ZC157]OEF01082.1 hypothetical protein A1QK_11475 [Vibrio genomosp. F10 str. 9ZD137]OEF07531.1 hypothetical protein A1QI_17425 [Vibrio genomosp. F10 str. 9ZB36]